MPGITESTKLVLKGPSRWLAATERSALDFRYRNLFRNLL